MANEVTYCKHCGKEIYRDLSRFFGGGIWLHSHTQKNRCDTTFAEPIQTTAITEARRAQNEVTGQERLL